MHTDELRDPLPPLLSHARCKPQGESITAEGGALAYMTANFDVKTRMREMGLLGTLMIFEEQSL
ncbi:MAG: hypothetical protein QMC96_05545 [Methanomicrobiales archaeon]|nr:hypothetical protein [Methanomicrobiales archaeon]